MCQIRRILGEARVLQNDLVPMLKQYKDDESLFDLLVRLLVNLTQVTSFEASTPLDISAYDSLAAESMIH